MGSTFNGRATILSVCCVGISGGLLLYKLYKSQQRKKIRKTLENLPAEIITEIVSYLSVEDFLNCESVWKQLNVFTENRHFAEKFMMRKKVSYLCNNYFSDYDCATKNRLTKTLATCDGLKLKTEYTREYCVPGVTWNFSLFIKNATIGHILKIPQPPNKIARVDYAFAFVPLAGVYKVVSVYPDDNKVKCAVLTLGGDGDKWRDLDIPERSDTDSQDVVQAGAIVHCVRDLENAFEIISLDMETECFTVTTVDKSFIAEGKEDKKHWAISWNNHLSFVYMESDQLIVWVFEDYKRNIWAADKLVIPLSVIMKEKPLNDGEVDPLFAWNGLLWFKVSCYARIGLDLETGKIAQKRSGRPGRDIDGGVFPLVPSFITLKGMQPRKKPRFHYITRPLSGVIPILSYCWNQFCRDLRNVHLV